MLCWQQPVADAADKPDAQLNMMKKQDVSNTAPQ